MRLERGERSVILLCLRLSSVRLVRLERGEISFILFR